MEFLALSKQQMFKIAAEYGLTSTQAFMLMLTSHEERRTMHSFCQILGCDASNITGLVDGLERKGLVARAEHPTDRRVKVLELSPKGKQIRDKILSQLSDQNKSYVLSQLTKDEVSQFTRLIQKITAGCPAKMAIRQEKPAAKA